MFNFANWILSAESAILTYEAGASGLLVGIAQSALAAMGIVLFIAFGLRSAQSVEHGQPAVIGGFMVSALKLAICGIVLRFWIVPSAVLGSPVGTWIPNFCLHLAQLVGWDGAQTVAQNLATWQGIEIPGQQFSVGFFYWLLAELFGCAACLVMAVVLVGPIAMVAVLVIIGPLFVPMWPIPELTAYARGYLRCLITYSLVVVLEAIIFFAIGKWLFPATATASGMAVSVEQFLRNSFILFLSLFVGLGMMVGVIKVANSIMSGSASSGHGLGFIAGAAGAVKMLF